METSRIQLKLVTYGFAESDTNVPIFFLISRQFSFWGKITSFVLLTDMFVNNLILLLRFAWLEHAYIVNGS